MQSPEQTAMHRAYDSTNKPKRRQPLPKTGLPRRRVKYAKKLPMNVKRQLKEAAERLKADTERLKAMQGGTDGTTQDDGGTQATD